MMCRKYLFRFITVIQAYIKRFEPAGALCTSFNAAANTVKITIKGLQ